MFIIRNIPEQKKIADIKPVTVTVDSPDLKMKMNRALGHLCAHIG